MVMIGMTKRFELRLCSNGTYYVYENGTLTDIDFDKFNRESAYALIDEVNALYEEKEKLKMFLKAVNEELSLANRDYDTLEEEYEQLKSTIKEVIELLSEEVDLFTEKATEHDINAYIKLKELDNKDAFHMAIATKKAIKMLKELEE